MVLISNLLQMVQAEGIAHIEEMEKVVTVKLAEQTVELVAPQAEDHLVVHLAVHRLEAVQAVE
jgi:hypothetical protein